VPGAKLEDTVVVDESGIEVLTLDPEWPNIAVRGIRRPLTLFRD
jgi:Xaa-Pro aminopeptidase